MEHVRENNSHDKCPLAAHSNKRVDDIMTLLRETNPVKTEIPLILGLDILAANILKKRDENIIPFSSTQEQERKTDDFAGYRQRMREFVEKLLEKSGAHACPITYIYQEAALRARNKLPLHWERIPGMPLSYIAREFVLRLRGAINDVAGESLQPKNVYDEGIAINIMGSLAPWEGTLTAICELYEQPGISAEVFDHIWPEIIRLNSDMGTHMATKYLGWVGRVLLDITSGDPQIYKTCLTAKFGPEDTVRFIFDALSMKRMKSRISRLNWEKIMKESPRFGTELIGCPAAHVAFSPGESGIKAGVGKVGSVIREVLFSQK